MQEKNFSALTFSNIQVSAHQFYVAIKSGECRKNRRCQEFGNFFQDTLFSVKKSPKMKNPRKEKLA